MTKKKPYSDPRWNDTHPGVVVGKVELTEEQKKKAEEWKIKLHQKYDNRT